MSDNSVIISCSSCGAKNRVPASRLEDRPVCGKCKTRLPGPSATNRPVDVTDASFQSEVLACPIPVLLDCWAPWCGPCKMVAPVLDEIAREYAGKIKVAKLNVDNNPATASRFRTQSIPTMILFKNGREIDRLVGAAPKQQIIHFIQNQL
ncbi:thioredoxin [Desulfatibacillum alkenivorans DSM 16219]|uniref:Thioredoxin n=1 Tax=Desulfatibacillum alkenivorans DSM 16219 TaxID=1121393 RepID=A0A1M6S3B0_9BACT|nr:thioredoxin TrxC [Desulfatibacillum alkenivorans]SHK39156.1 thioredoxin [Desulfatibacillum alkenivorans DSM 16219]